MLRFARHSPRRPRRQPRLSELLVTATKARAKAVHRSRYNQRKTAITMDSELLRSRAIKTAFAAQGPSSASICEQDVLPWIAWGRPRPPSAADGFGLQHRLGVVSVSRGSVPHRVRFLQSDADIRLPMVPGTVSGYGTRQSTSSSEVYPITLHSSGLNGESGRTLGRPPQHAGACFAKFLVGQTAAHDAVRAPSKGVEGQSGFPPTFKTACKTLQSVRERRILSEALAGGTACTGPVNSRRIQLLRGSEVLFVR